MEVRMSEKKNLYQKIVNVMSKVKYISNDIKVDLGNNKSYPALSEEKVLKIIREEMIINKLCIIPTGIDCFTVTKIESLNSKVQYNLTNLVSEYNICDAESGESERIMSAGQGHDSGDKGAGKAMTYALKSALLKLFVVPQGNDPDKYGSPEDDMGDTSIQSTLPLKSAQAAAPTEKEEKRQTKLTRADVGACLVEYEKEVKIDMNECRRLFVTPYGVSLGDVKPEKYPEIVLNIKNKWRALPKPYDASKLRLALEIIGETL